MAKLESKAAISRDPDDYFELSDTIEGLARLYARRCFFLLADIRRVEASMMAAARQLEPPGSGVSSSSGDVVRQQETGIATSTDQCQEENDDWEALADNEFSLANLSISPPAAADASVSKHSNEVETDVPARRRGRGSFLYRTNELYSDQVDDADLVDHDSEVRDTSASSSLEESGTVRNKQFGTSHVILLYDFPSITRITYLESLFENFRERGVAIKRVSYTVALAVFRTPSAAQEAQTSIEFPFKVRRLEEGDIELHKIPQEDLEPPAARPRSSPTTAQRMIGHAMGMDPGSSAGARSEEFKRQEAARKDRLHRRHDMMDAAWGPDE